MSQIRKPVEAKGRFKNSEQERHHGFFFSTFRMWLKSVPTRFSYLSHSFDDWLVSETPLKTAQKPTITWIGHSTFLIQVQGINILTDPIFFNISTFFKRNLPPGIALGHLPPIDVVLISHNHWDHMHGPSLMALRDNITTREGQILVPHGDQHWFIRRKFNRVNSYTWGKHELIAGPAGDDAVKITFLPAWHWSRRGIFDRNKSLWGSWMIEAGGHTIYFAGDTAYSDHFAEISAAFPKIDIALLPIGPCEPRGAMKHTHIDANEAGQAFLDLKAQTFIPMHWGTFNFGFDRFLTPVEKIDQWWQGQNFENAQKIAMFKVGQRKEFASE
jgi:L-ascorbate metabolism protein UlaG (beta-lactamase superfamily)